MVCFLAPAGHKPPKQGGELKGPHRHDLLFTAWSLHPTITTQTGGRRRRCPAQDDVGEVEVRQGEQGVDEGQPRGGGADHHQAAVDARLHLAEEPGGRGRGCSSDGCRCVGGVLFRFSAASK